METMEFRSIPRAARSSTATRAGPESFWLLRSPVGGRAENYKRTLKTIVERYNTANDAMLFDAVEAGVPTRMVEVIAKALGEDVGRVMEVFGVSKTTFRRKDGAHDPLPEAAGHRVMGFIRIAALLRRLLCESGDLTALADFDVEGWLAAWIRAPLPQLNGKTPAEMLRNPEGQRAVEQVLERMRGGLPA